MIVVVGGIKGGTGKTTLATNLTVIRAASGKKVLLVDGDEQKSATKWSDQRSNLGFVDSKFLTICLNGKSIFTQVPKLKVDYDDIIIDVGGRETSSLRAAIAIADIFIIPFKPRSLDIWTLGEIKTVISEMKQANPNLESYAVINQADAKGSDNEDALSILQECEDITCLDITIGSRKAFANAASDGLGVIEMKNNDKKAVQEMYDLYDLLYNEHTT